MKRNYSKLVLLAVILIAAVWNIHQNRKTAEISDIAAANIKALASGETGGGALVYAQSIIITDSGSRTECISGILCKITSYDVGCIGYGNLPCSSGSYERMDYMGNCYWVK